MVSAVDPKTIGEALDRIGRQASLFTTDSDAPKSNRIADIGSSNVDAGEQAGEIALKAMPDGGKCMASSACRARTTRVSASKASRTRSAARRSRSSTFAPTTSTRPRAKRNVEDTMTADPAIDCMVGYYSYNTPQIDQALKEAGKLGQITIVGFDEDQITLGGVKEGSLPPPSSNSLTSGAIRA